MPDDHDFLPPDDHNDDETPRFLNDSELESDGFSPRFPDSDLQKSSHPESDSDNSQPWTGDSAHDAPPEDSPSLHVNPPQGMHLEDPESPQNETSDSIFRSTPLDDEPRFVEPHDDLPFAISFESYDRSAQSGEVRRFVEKADQDKTTHPEDAYASDAKIFEAAENQDINPLEEDIQYFLDSTGGSSWSGIDPETIGDTETFEIEDHTPPIQPRRTVPPAPEEQSTFVNPAMARVAAARPRQSRQEPGEIWLGIRTILIVMAAALAVSFIFNYWTPESFLSDEFVANLQVVSSTQGPPTAVPSPLPTFASVQKVGIITGHSGPPLNPAFTVDPGAVCDENFDGVPELTELDINRTISLGVANLLVEAGYEVEMLNEWDPRLTNYRASALVSIHTNTCENLGFGASGFNVKANERSPLIDRDNKLVDCVVADYANSTGLARHFGSPPDLADYHAFREVSVDTPTVIIELGFMFADRAVLTQQPEAMARGIFQGIDCFLKPGQVIPAAATLPAS